MLRTIYNKNIKSGAEMKIRPLRDRVLVARIEKKDKTSGGIIIPDTAREKPQEAQVIAVGPGNGIKTGNECP